MSGTLHWYHWLVVAASLMLTLGAWYITSQQARQKMALQFNFQAEHIIELVRERMRKYEDALWSGTAALHALPGELTNAQWQAFSKALSLETKYPGINGIGVIHYVPPDQLPGYLAAQRMYRPGYKIHPPHQIKEYWPITHIEPVETNRKAVGLDMAHENNRFSAAKKARDTGTAQITAPIVLVQDAKKTPGFLFYAPYYQGLEIPKTLDLKQKAFKGIVYAPFIMARLMDGTLQNENRLINFSIHDGKDLLYNELSQDSVDFDPDPLFRMIEDIDLYGRIWHFDLRSSLLFRQQNSNPQPLMILVGGLVIDTMLLVLFFVLATANKRAVDYADTVTHTLVERNQALERSNAELDQFAYVASHDLKAPLNAISKLAAWIEEDSGDALPQVCKPHLSLLKGRVQRMASLLDDLLMFSRVGRDNYELEAINLKTLTGDIAQLLGIPSGFICQAPDISVQAYRVPLDQVLRNLIGNALKHHDQASGTIDISVALNETGFTLSVNDDGPGIPAHLHEKALEMFQTLKPRDEVEGSGMGLAMCKKIVEHYGGSLIIESDGEQGTHIITYWPLAQQEVK